jgi:hypothetical protein
MPDWVRIKRNKYQRPSVIDHSGKTAMASVSPYDVPEGIRARSDPNNPSVLIVEFRYSTSEPLEYRSELKGIMLGIGKNSGRLYEVKIDATIFSPAQDCQVRISEAGLAIDRLSSDSSLFRRAGNYRITKRLLSEGNILSPLEASAV